MEIYARQNRTERTNEEQSDSRCRTLKTENANYLISKWNVPFKSGNQLILETFHSTNNPNNWIHHFSRKTYVSHIHASHYVAKPNKSQNKHEHCQHPSDGLNLITKKEPFFGISRCYFAVELLSKHFQIFYCRLFSCMLTINMHIYIYTNLQARRKETKRESVCA